MSQGGKDEMSHRIWEGVRRDEYKFSELPDVVRDREEKQAYFRLHDTAIGADRLPAADRDDFFRAYEAADRKEAAKVLDRNSFRQNLFLGDNSGCSKHTSVTTDKAAGAKAVVANTDSKAPGKDTRRSAPEDSLSSLDLASIDLSGVRPPEHDADGAVANLQRSGKGLSRGSGG